MIELKQSVVVLDWVNPPETAEPKGNVAGRGSLFLHVKNDKDVINGYRVYLHWEKQYEKIFESLSEESVVNKYPYFAMIDTVKTGEERPTAISFCPPKAPGLSHLLVGKYPFRIIVAPTQGDTELALEAPKEALPVADTVEELQSQLTQNPSRFKVFNATLVIPTTGNWNYKIQMIDARDEKDTANSARGGIYFKWWLRRAAKIEAVVRNNRNDWLYCRVDTTEVQNVELDPRMQFGGTPDWANRPNDLPWPLVAVPPMGTAQVPLLLRPKKKPGGLFGRSIWGQKQQPVNVNQVRLRRIDAPTNKVAARDVNPDVDAPVSGSVSNEVTQPTGDTPTLVYVPLFRTFDSNLATVANTIMQIGVVALALVMSILLITNLVYNSLKAEPIQSVVEGKRIELVGKFLDGATVSVTNLDGTKSYNDWPVKFTAGGKAAKKKYLKRSLSEAAQALISGDSPVPEPDLQAGYIEFDPKALGIARGEQVKLRVKRSFLIFPDFLLPHWDCVNRPTIGTPEPKKEPIPSVSVNIGGVPVSPGGVAGTGGVGISTGGTKPGSNGSGTGGTNPGSNGSGTGGTNPGSNGSGTGGTNPGSNGGGTTGGGGTNTGGGIGRTGRGVRTVDLNKIPSNDNEKATRQEELEYWCRRLQAPALYNTIRQTNDPDNPLGFDLSLNSTSKQQPQDVVVSLPPLAAKPGQTITPSSYYVQIYWLLPNGDIREMLGYSNPMGIEMAVWDVISKPKNRIVPLSNEEFGKQIRRMDVGRTTEIVLVAVAVRADNIKSEDIQKPDVFKHLYQTQPDPNYGWSVVGKRFRRQHLNEEFREVPLGVELKY